MPVLVQKYGGTSVDGPERLRAVARRVAAARAGGDDLVVVVSAMGHTTDELIALAHQVSKDPNRRELDMLVTTGERVSMALLAMALHDLGVEAISFTGSQSGILTSGPHSAARIAEVKPERIRGALADGRVAIVAGFQGVDPGRREITTLGRGGSDTTAVALAAALQPARCEIYTDVSGVYTADPRVVPDARIIPELGYRSCSALAHLGGRVLHARCVDLAARARVPLTVRSSFDDHAGTRIVEDRDMEAPRIEAITHRRECAVVVAEGNAGARAEARGIVDAVAAAFPEIELVAHEQASDTHAALVWIAGTEDATALEREFRTLRGPGGEWRLTVTPAAAMVSVVGLGLGSAEVVRAEAALDKAGVPMIALRTMPTGLVFRVPDARADEAVRALHAVFLAAPAVAR
jgi:aspartate kinase